jgi:dTDP-4-amino-4,6-dideoxy-D-galactose acyltransferase
VDEKLTFSMVFEDFKENIETGADIKSLLGKARYQKKLEELCLISGHCSRFKLDSTFPEGEFERLYLKWLENSQNGSFADELLGCFDHKELLGFISLKKLEGFLQIGLIAVDEKISRKGIGRKLLQAAQIYANQFNLNQIQVVTQGLNKIACAFYEKNGYSISSRQFIYHYWLN